MGQEKIISMSLEPIYEFFLQNISKGGIQTKPIKVHLE
jgi:hypothetical protein